MTRKYSFIDRCLSEIDHALRTAHSNHNHARRANPASEIDSPDELSPEEKRCSASLMRINHSGEVAAQALYKGQALFTRNAEIHRDLENAAIEEIDHLDWCEQRLKELNSRPSHLAPLWYIGSYGIGMIAGLSAQKWGLGFIVETERQVATHLQGHLQKLPATDQRSRAIVSQMQLDEIEHANHAKQMGGAELPKTIKFAMRQMAKVMTRTSAKL